MNSADRSIAGQQLEALLRDSQPRHAETLFRNTVEDAPVGIAFADRQGRYRHCNRAFHAMLGFDAEELKGESMESLTHSADLQSTTAGLERLWNGEIAHLEVEKRYLRKSGGALWVHATTSLVSGGGPEPECSVEFLLDISARKQMAATLLQNQTLLATVIAELPIALVACDVRGQLTHHNHAAAELFGIPAEETDRAVPRNPYPLASQVYRADGTTPVPREDRPLARTLLGDKVRDAEFIIVRPDGVRRTVFTSAQRLLGQAGQPLGALAMIEDITERRLAEEELERVHKQLLVASRQAGMAEVATNVLHNVGNVLNSVNVSASIVSERIRKSKCTGLTRVAALLGEHAPDLTAFLTGAQGRHLPVYLQELAAELIAERDVASAELAQLRGNVEHIKEIVAMQQNYARRSGLTDLIDIRTLVEDSLRMNAGAFSRHGVTLVRDFQEVPLITVDKHKVLQILVNVIRNAKYACDESGSAEKRVTVRVRATNDTMLIAVIDTGVGIPAENLERIFSHGFTTREDGHGFGLHSCALAAKDLNGSLQAESAGFGQGATFTLTLPLTQPELPMADDSELPTHRLLMIDDNPAIHEDYRKILAGRDDTQISAAEAALFGEPQSTVSRPIFDLDSALQGREGVELARRALSEGCPYSVAFVDMRMPPGWDGLETIENLWKVDPEIQVVVCSAYSDYDWMELLTRLGHSDKLIVIKKPFEPIEILQSASALSRKWQNAGALKRHVEGLEGVVTDRTRGLEAANRQLRHLASHDSLTGLPNRLLLEDRITQAIAQAKRQEHEFAVAVLDLDRFKLINDSLGHRAGDELLCEVAARLKGAIRTVDSIARLGGDEFVIVFDGPMTRAATLQMGMHLLKVMEPSKRLLGIDVHVSPSIGIAFYPGDGTTIDTLLAHADAAMYHAKERGRNNVQCYTESMGTVTQEWVKLGSELHEALRGEQFELHYQPQVDTATGRINSAEALIRWRHPQRGLLLPAEFIPVADECGLLDAIGEWVLDEACRQGRIWQQRGPRAIRIAVNLAPSQFRLVDLAGQIRRALDASGLDPALLEIELTETAVMSDAEESVHILEAISRMGVLVSVDDFGTGYSSMSYLRRFPIDKLKIDRCFVEQMDTRPEDASIVGAIISLAHSLHLKVIAEGVETLEQLQLLTKLGCDQYQGFYFSPAVLPAKFEELLEEDPLLTDEDAARTHSKLAGLKG